MNKQQLEAMQEKINKMQEELNELKQAQEEEAAKQDLSFPAILPDEGTWFISAGNFYPTGMARTSAIEEDDQNIFPSKDVANGYADAFRVMLELRRCEGAGHYCEDIAYSFDPYYGSIAVYDEDNIENFCIVPPFPTEELAQAAIDKVGCSRILAAYKFLANVK